MRIRSRKKKDRFNSQLDTQSNFQSRPFVTQSSKNETVEDLTLQENAS